MNLNSTMHANVTWPRHVLDIDGKPKSYMIDHNSYACAAHVHFCLLHPGGQTGKEGGEEDEKCDLLSEALKPRLLYVIIMFLQT